MIFHCHDPFDAIGYGITRIRQLGVHPDDITRHNNEILQGKIVITHDRKTKRPWFAVVGQDVRWSTVIKAMGLK